MSRDGGRDRSLSRDDQAAIEESRSVRSFRSLGAVDVRDVAIGTDNERAHSVDSESARAALVAETRSLRGVAGERDVGMGSGLPVAVSTADLGGIPVLVALKDGPPQEEYFLNKQAQTQAERDEEYQNSRKYDVRWYHTSSPCHHVGRAPTMTLQTLSIVFMVLVGYVSIGGILFHFMESGHEERQHLQTEIFIDTFLEDHQCVTKNDYQELLRTVVTAATEGVIHLQTPNTTFVGHAKWNIQNAVFFASTVVTTIGFGFLAPRTEAGRIFCIFYAMIGIPICLVFLVAVGERLNFALQCLLEKVRWFRANPKTGLLAKALMLLLFGNIFLVIIPAVGFCAVEGWTAAQTVYFIFMTLSTIGFGDFVAGVNPMASYPYCYRLSRIIWLIVGLAWVSTIIGAKYEFFRTMLLDREGRLRGGRYWRHGKGHSNKGPPGAEVREIHGGDSSAGTYSDRTTTHADTPRSDISTPSLGGSPLRASQSQNPRGATHRYTLLPSQEDGSREMSRDQSLTADSTPGGGRDTRYAVLATYDQGQTSSPRLSTIVLDKDMKRSMSASQLRNMPLSELLVVKNNVYMLHNATSAGAVNRDAPPTASNRNSYISAIKFGSLVEGSPDGNSGNSDLYRLINDIESGASSRDDVPAPPHRTPLHSRRIYAGPYNDETTGGSSGVDDASQTQIPRMSHDANRSPAFNIPAAGLHRLLFSSKPPDGVARPRDMSYDDDASCESITDEIITCLNKTCDNISTCCATNPGEHEDHRPCSHCSSADHVQRPASLPLFAQSPGGARRIVAAPSSSKSIAIQTDTDSQKARPPPYDAGNQTTSVGNDSSTVTDSEMNYQANTLPRVEKPSATSANFIPAQPQQQQQQRGLTQRNKFAPTGTSVEHLKVSRMSCEVPIMNQDDGFFLHHVQGHIIFTDLHGSIDNESKNRTA